MNFRCTKTTLKQQENCLETGTVKDQNPSGFGEAGKLYVYTTSHCIKVGDGVIDFIFNVSFGQIYWIIKIVCVCGLAAYFNAFLKNRSGGDSVF